MFSMYCVVCMGIGNMCFAGSVSRDVIICSKKQTKKVKKKKNTHMYSMHHTLCNVHSSAHALCT